MRGNRRFLALVSLLAVLAVVFGLVGTIAPPLTEAAAAEQSSSSVAHFQNPPTYDSGWVDITTKNGQYFALKHGLNTTEVFVDVSGKQSLDPMGGALAWSKNYGGPGDERANSIVQTSDGGYALAGENNTVANIDFWLVKVDSAGVMQWSKSYGGALYEKAYSLVQTSDGGYALAGTNSSVNSDFCLVKVDSAGNMQWSKNYGAATVSEAAFSLVQTTDGGYALGGSNSSIAYDFCLVKVDSAGNMQWSKNYGTATRVEFASSMVQTVDGGYALTGRNGSWPPPGTNFNFCLVKVDSAGNMQWSKNYGTATSDERARSLVQTVDGGYALAGSNVSAGIADFCLVKVDSAGVMQWSKNYGTATSGEVAWSLVETVDSGYALGGVNSSAYNYDFCLVKADSAGNMQWSKNYGGAGYEEAYSLVQTVDEGYALAGYTSTYGAVYDLWLVKVKGELDREHKRYLGGTNLIPGWTGTYGRGSELAYSLVQTVDGGYALAGYNTSAGTYYFCLVKVDSAGNMQWSKNYGTGTGYKAAWSLVQTSDGGYALAGYNTSAGAYDFCLVKTNSGGVMQWSRNYGTATNSEVAYSLVQTVDGGYALAGCNSSGGYDFCLVKADSAGVMEWSKNYGAATSGEEAVSLVQTSDGGYALAGYNYTAGNYDFCLVKADAVGVMQWSRNYGTATNSEVAYSLVQTVDGGYALAGYNSSGGYDFCLVKADSAGNMQWSKNYGGIGYDTARSIVQTSDGGYALAGSTYSFGVGGDFWLVKADSAGNMQWNRNYGGAGSELDCCVVQTLDGGYALAGYTTSFGGYRFWLVKTDIEMGLAVTDVAKNAVTLYRGKTDLYWNYVRVRIWTIKEPTWIYGDINMDGAVDVKDLYIVSRNYGKTLSLLSLSGIAFVAGIQTYKTRKKHHNQA